MLWAPGRSLPVALLTAAAAIAAAAAAQGGAAPEVAGFQLLGASPCEGDNLYRPVNSFQASLSIMGKTWGQIVEECTALCGRLANGTTSRCMGVQVSSDGLCSLFDRDWVVGEKEWAEAALGMTLDDNGVAAPQASQAPISCACLNRRHSGP